MAPAWQLPSQQSSQKSPLLPPVSGLSSEIHDGFAGASLPSAVLSLTTSVVGAGIMGLPATVKTLGLVPGILLILFFGLLADVGVEMMLKFSSAGKVISYAGLMADSFGRRGRILLQSCVLISNFGILVVYLIITGSIFGLATFELGDVLSGSTSSAVHHSGVLEEWAGGPTWWNSRLMVMLFTTVFLLIPLVSFKHVDSLRLSSALSVALALMFVIVMGVITITKIAIGHISMPRLFPQIDSQYSILELFAVVPVIVTAYICHPSVHPILNELQNSSDSQSVVRTSLGLCTSIYVTMSFFGYILFGESTMEDVLSNFDTNLGVPYSDVLCDIVRVGYALHLVLVFPLVHFTLRLNLDGLLFPASPPLSKDNRRFILLTSCIISLLFLAAYLVPNIWVAFQFTGATAAVCLGFIFPGIVCLRDVHGIATRQERWFSWVMVVLAVISSAVAISSDIISIFLSKTDASPAVPLGNITKQH